MTLEVTNAGKKWAGDVWGVRNVSLELEDGIVGLLGPNGAGKSSFMQLLATVTRPTEGEIRWNGTDIVEQPRAVRSVLGYLPQDFGVYPNLTAAEFLKYMASLKGLPKNAFEDRVNELLRITNLADDRDRKLGEFSGGMRQRVGIAQALLNDPDLLIVDEPTVGLDPAERVRFRNVIGDLTEDRLVIHSTHIVSDVESTATELVLMEDGGVVRQTTPEKLIDDVTGTTWEWVVSSDRLSTVKDTYPITKTVRSSDGVRVRAVSDERPAPDATSVEPTLEDAYLSTIGNDVGT